MKLEALAHWIDPLFTGYRGIYYTENDIIRYNLFAEIGQRQQTGKITGTLTFGGDILYVKRDDRKGLNAIEHSAEITSSENCHHNILFTR